MGINVNEITSAEWSLSLRGQGEVEQGFDDINQCIRLIVSTQRGTDPMRPNFGCDMWQFIDRGINNAVPQMVNEILSALGTWETRIEITNINYAIEEESVKFNILWILQGNKQRGSAGVTLDFAPQKQTEAPPVIIAPIDVPVLSAVYTYPDGVLSWTFPSPIGVSFQILRSANGGVFEQIGTANSVLTYTDLSIDLDTLFAYQIRAVKGSRVSDFSNIENIQTLTPYLGFSATAPLYIDIQKTGTADIVQSSGGISKVYLLDDDPENITAFLADDAGDPAFNAGISGTLALGDTFSGLRTIRARSQSFTLGVGDWVRNASVSIDVSESIVSLARVTSLVDNVILSNGGTITDDGTSYTGTPGETHASRLLTIGTLEIDVTAPENAILYEKILALETVGWTVSTISTLCDKTLVVDTAGNYFVSGFLERTRNLEGLDFISGDPLTVKLYDTEANADAGGATGLLADGYTAVDTYLRNDTNYNAWALGTVKGLRFEAFDTGSTDNLSNLRYLAAATEDRPCGENNFVDNFLLGNAQVFDGTFDYDVVSNFNQTERTQSVSYFLHLDFEDNVKLQRILTNQNSADGAGLTRGFIIDAAVRGGDFVINFLLSGADSDFLLLYSNTPISLGRHAIHITYDGTSDVSGVKMYIDGVQSTTTTISNTLSGSVIPINSKDLFIGRLSTSYGGDGFKFNGNIKTIEILSRVATLSEIEQSTELGSFRSAGIAHNSGEYLLAVDFDKVDGQNPATFTDTPTYTITGVGGTTYTPYL